MAKNGICRNSFWIVFMGSPSLEVLSGGALSSKTLYNAVQRVQKKNLACLYLAIAKCITSTWPTCRPLHGLYTTCRLCSKGDNRPNHVLCNFFSKCDWPLPFWVNFLFSVMKTTLFTICKDAKDTNKTHTHTHKRKTYTYCKETTEMQQSWILVMNI